MRKLLPVALVAALMTAWGCGPQKPVGWQNPLDVMEKSLPADAKNPNYVLTRMEFAQFAIDMGCYSRAKVRLNEAFGQFDVNQSNVAATIGSESYKYYKGETYERAMVCWYLGYIAYQAGDYNNARIYFARSLAEDRKAVVNKDTPEIYGDDFGLAYFWLGKAYQKLGDADNARIAFQKAGGVSPRKSADSELAKDRDKCVAVWKACLEGEDWCLKTFGDPKEADLYISQMADLRKAYEDSLSPATQPAALSKDEFLTPSCQQDANFVLTIELGNPPYKYLSGIQNETTNVGRPVIYPSSVAIYVDGQLAGQAVQILDMWHQAATQDRIMEKEGVQTGKAVMKTAIEMFSGYDTHWDVSGDARYWTSLRGRAFVHAAKLLPGVHTVALRMYDINGKALPRWTNTYYGITVPAAGESCVLLAPRYNGDNQLPPEMYAKAFKAGATAVEP